MYLAHRRKAFRTQAAPSGGLTSGLVSYWRMNQDLASEPDIVGSNTLTDVNTVRRASGQLGDARDFIDDNNEHLVITNGAQSGLNFAGSFSFNVWVNHDNYFVHDMPIFSKWDGGLNSFSYILFTSASTANARWFVRSGGGNISVDIARPSTGAWHLYQGYYDTTTGVVGLRIDAGSWTTASGNTGGPDSSTANFYVGARASNNSPFVYFEGLIDDFGLWSRRLSDDEFNDLWNSGSGVAYPF